MGVRRPSPCDREAASLFATNLLAGLPEATDTDPGGAPGRGEPARRRAAAHAPRRTASHLRVYDPGEPLMGTLAGRTEPVSDPSPGDALTACHNHFTSHVRLEPRAQGHEVTCRACRARRARPALALPGTATQRTHQMPLIGAAASVDEVRNLRCFCHDVRVPCQEMSGNPDDTRKDGLTVRMT
jgi:hypothetical protein